MSASSPAIALSADRPNRAIPGIWLAAAAMLLVTWWHVFGLIAQDRGRLLAARERDLANLTRVSQEHASRTLRSADQVIRFVQSRYLEIGERLDLADLTAKGVIDAEIFNQVGVIDASGVLVLSSVPFKAGLDLRDREHFKVHVAGDTGQLFVSKPVLGRASAKWSIQLTRRITRANGEFAGVVVVSIDPGYFSQFYGELNLGQRGMAALYGLDGVARVRKVGVREEFGSSAPNAPMFGLIANGTLAGAYTARSAVDGIERLYYYRTIPQYPLVVSAGLEQQELLVNHHRARNDLLLQATMLSLLILALALALTRHLSRMRRDWAARQITQLQVQDRTEQLNAIFALSPDGFVSFDREHRVKYLSPAFVQMTASDTRQLEGLDEHDFSAWLASRCTAGTPFEGIDALRSQGGQDEIRTRRLIEIDNLGKRVLQIGLRTSESSSVSQILYFRDVTYETEVDQMKSEFLSTAAHELRTPMASIFGFAEVLREQDLDAPTQRDFLNIIYEQSKLMADILNELLDLARIEARRGKDFRYAAVCLQELIDDIVKAFKVPAGRDAPELVAPGQPVYVMADAGKLQQAVRNVLSNAYKYSPAGGPVRLQIELRADAGRPSRACLHVTDQGIGMTALQLRRVCERFYRADTSGKILGTGLGMSIVKEIIELHGGEIDIASTAGRGTCVSLCLPTNWVAPPADSAPQPLN